MAAPNWFRDFARDHVWPFMDQHQQAPKDALYRWLVHMTRTDSSADMIRQLEQGRMRLELERRPGWERMNQEVTDRIEEILARADQGCTSGNAARFTSPLEPSFKRKLSCDESLVALLALNEETRAHSQRIRPAECSLFGVVCRDVHGLREEHLPALRTLLKTATQGIAPAEQSANSIQYVTLDQIAAVVHRVKRTLEKYKTRARNPLPPPNVEGGGGKPDEWIWSIVRPWLEKEFSRILPERFPS